MQDHWWKTGVIYQIYPKSFQDTTGSGTGDLQGIIQRLDYLAELGVAGIWLTPIYPSPQIDNGYDIADYCAINPDYGTMADFEQLVEQAHCRHIRIIMDMVFNHTSTQHPWFRASAANRPEYRDYYIWQGSKRNQAPNNWQSKFGGNAWHWSATRQQHYLHLFATEQADLNWENPKVRSELKKICHFWADKGVDGLRLDVINLVSKNQDFPQDATGDGRRFYTDGPKIHQYLQELSREVFQPRQLMTVGEMSSTSLPHCQQYANLQGSELSMTFNFHHLKVDYPNGVKWQKAPPDFVQLKAIFNHWQQGMHNRAWNALFWCNHDQPRIVSRFGDEGALRTISAKMLAMVLYGMQGTPYIYQGEEIGMTNPHFSSIEQYRDVESLNMYQRYLKQGYTESELLAILQQKSRDNSRTPMQWDNSRHGGFSLGEPWIEVASNYLDINVAYALADNHSVFYCYQKLIKLRQQFSIFSEGDYQDLNPQHPYLWCYQRSCVSQKLQVLANLSDKATITEFDLADYQQNWQCWLNNYPDLANASGKLLLQPYQALYFYSG